MIEVDLLSHKIKYMAKASRMISEKLPCDMVKSESAETQKKGIETILAQMVKSVDEVLFSESPSEITRALTVNNDLPKDRVAEDHLLRRRVQIHLSEACMSDWWVHGDTGPILAEAYKNGRAYQDL